MLNDNDLRRIQALKAENTELRHLFEMLEDDHKMTLSYISHELRNTLAFIISSLQLIETTHSEAKQFKYWDDIVHDLNYMKGLLISMSDFNNSNMVTMSPTNLKELAQQVYRGSYSLAKARNINFNYTSCEESCMVNADATKLKQALLNLIKNAFEAVDDNGTVLLDIKASDNSIMITIADNGSGISHELMQQLYTPFITTKKDGTGLGLSIAKRIVETHNGILRIHSKPEVGTKITIVLPNSQAHE